MNNRFTLQEMAGILATQTGRTKKASEEFLREFIAVVIEGAFTDRMVKIKGLGTFKVIEVEDRESVNVNTGQRFVIPGHYRFNFTPEKELKELINKPFSFFDTTEIYSKENLQKLTETTEETEEKPLEIAVDEEPIAEESIEASVSEEHIMEESIEIPIEEELIVEELTETPAVEESIVEEPTEAPAVEESIVEEPFDTTLVEETIEVIEEKVIVSDKQLFTEPAKVAGVNKPKKKNKALLLLFVLLLVVALGVLAFLFLAPAQRKPSQPVEPVKEIVNEPNTEIPQEIETPAEEPVPTPETKKEEEFPTVLGHVTIEPGTRLTSIAEEYYKKKIFWVYIYEFNKDKIKDPNNIPVGTTLAIPAPQVYGIDANDRASFEKASLLQSQIVAGEK